MAQGGSLEMFHVEQSGPSLHKRKNQMKTYQERLIAGLTAMGYKPDPTNKSHYKAFVHPQSDGRLFVGTNGALRSGRTASSSHSVGDPSRQTGFYTKVLAKGDAAASEAKVIGPKSSVNALMKEFGQ